MCKIVTITFSPCVDKSTSVFSLIPEKKLACSSPRLEAGGGGINVAKAIKKLGGEALAVFPSGGYTGKYFDHLLKEKEIPSIIIKSINETRENIIVFEEKTNQQFRFGMPGTFLYEAEWKKCLQAVEQIDGIQFLIASGSLPPGVPIDIYAQLARIASNKNIKFIVDATGDALLNAVKEEVYMLKPNLSELAFLAKKNELQPGEAKSIAETMVANGKIKIIVVSMGAAGALLVTKDTAIEIAAPPVIKKSTVGAGDSMVAGIVFSLAQGKDILQAVQYGVACGTAATLNPGSELCNKSEANKLFNNIYADWIYNR